MTDSDLEKIALEAKWLSAEAGYFAYTASPEKLYPMLAVAIHQLCQPGADNDSLERSIALVVILTRRIRDERIAPPDVLEVIFDD
jgi:hypothetical protein